MVDSHQTYENDLKTLLSAIKTTTESEGVREAALPLLTYLMESVESKQAFVAILSGDEVDEFIPDTVPFDKTKLTAAVNIVIKKRACIVINENKDLPEGVGSMLLSPIIRDEKIIGVLGLPRAKDGFNDLEISICSAYSSILSLAYQAEVHELSEEALYKAKFAYFEEIKHISSQLAHGLRSPLQTIQNAIYLLKMNPKRDELLVMINESVKYSTFLLDSFREYYRGHEIKKVPADINETLSQAILAAEVPENITVKQKKGVNEKISYDATKMLKAIENMIKNSIEAMPDGGTLTVESIDAGTSVKILITDTGVGIPESKGDSIFQPFGPSSTGIGLGLAMCKRVVEAHLGTISYTSEVNKGTTFTIEFPK